MEGQKVTTIIFSVACICIFIGMAAGHLMGIEKGKQQFRDELAEQVDRLNVLERGLGLDQLVDNELLRNKILQTCIYIEGNYVEPISMDSLSEIVIPNIIKELDPHSAYIPRREMQAYNEPLEGEFDGIGVVFNAATDTVIVLNVVPNGPSEKVGVKAGDRIIYVNDTIIAGVKMPQTDIMKRLRGKRGTSVELKVERQGLDELLAVEVVRDVIPIHSVESAFMIADGVGFIHLSQFASTTYREVHEALDKLREAGATKLILDLRGNAGGFLDQAILVANEFLPKEKLIVYTTGRNVQEQLRQYSNGRGSAQDMEVVVLIDEQSASASEIVAGALQDNDRGTIIGRRSFGKGLVQNQLMLDDGSALRLTIAKYHTPTGRCIQRPYEKGKGEEYYIDDMVRRIENNEYFTLDSIHFADSLKYTTPGGKIVYGGGGIMPDEFVPLDTTYVSNYFTEVSVRNILYRYTIDYTDRHRQQIDSIRTMADLDAFFAADKDLMRKFYDYAASQGIKGSRTEIARSRSVMEAQIKAYIGRNTPLEDDAFYHCIYPIDETLRRAVEKLTR